MSSGSIQMDSWPASYLTMYGPDMEAIERGNLVISGTYDTRWNNDVLNPAFGSLRASDFDVIALDYRPPTGPTAPTNIRIIGGLLTAPWHAVGF
jgi:hypothetical protein